jgi:hypothetical protein
MVDVLPELATAEFVAVSDDEFTGLLQIFLKGAHVVKCENYGCGTIKPEGGLHGLRGRLQVSQILLLNVLCQIILAFISFMAFIAFVCRYLIRSESREAYQNNLVKTIGRWSAAYQSCYLQHLNPEIDLYSMWLAKELKFQVTETSIFSYNNCEHLNFMAAALQELKQVSNSLGKCFV